MAAVMAATLLLLTPAELTQDPRARRAAHAARAAGWSVVGLCPGGAGERSPLDGVTIHRVGAEPLSRALRGFGVGGGRHDPAVMRELRGVYRLMRLSLASARLWRRGRLLEAVEVVHANDFDTLPAGWLIARSLGARLVYDAHELYTAQESDPPRVHKAVVAFLEGIFARGGHAVVTVSEPIASELKRRLRLVTTPFVVLNCPPLSASASPPSPAFPLRVVYQGAVGHGRSVEDILHAAAETKGVAVSLRIVGIDHDRLRRDVSARGLDKTVTVLDPVGADALVDSLSAFDVGIVVTRRLTLNDELALPNKLFEYMMAGLGVVASRLAGVSGIVESEGVGLLFDPGSPSSLAACLSSLAQRPAEVQAMKTRARLAAVERFNADAQRSELLAAWTS
jgi:glycosyltransferase involved in cell wall biosynthesis